MVLIILNLLVGFEEVKRCRKYKMKYFFISLIFAVMFSPIVLGVYINKELKGNKNAVEYAERENCLIMMGPDCPLLTMHEE